MSKLARIAPGLMAAMLAAGPAAAQGNLDAGKSAAQIFAQTCNACHKSARELKASSASFLREHYTTGPQEASAMASYLSGVGSDPRAVQQRRPPGSGPAEEPGGRSGRPGEREAALPPGGQARRPDEAPRRASAPALNQRPSTGTEASKPVTAAIAPLVRTSDAGAAPTNAAAAPARAAGPRLPDFEE